MESQYAFLMQASAAVTGMVFAMTALGSVVLALLAEYRLMAMSDPLSGLLNRRGFEEAASRISGSLPASVVACDIDHFKTVNDRFGHGRGDRVIADLAASIRAHLPQGAIAARFGGEEFVLLLPGSKAWEAALVAETMRAAFAAEGWKSAALDMPVTASFGVSELAASDFNVHDAVRRADEALYDAKRRGRNRIVTRMAGTVAPQILPRPAAA